MYGRSRVFGVSFEDVNMMKLDNQQNSKTDEFRHPEYVVVRRGRTVNFAVKMSSSNFNAQSVVLDLQRGNYPQYNRGSKFLGTCTTEPRKYYEWEMKVVNVESTTVYYQLQVPFDAPVGAYSGTVRIPTDRWWNSPSYNLKTKIAIIFNPYDSGDTVYMADEAMRQEYVNNEMGRIFAGSDEDMFTWYWNFAQFENVALDAVLYMMDQWELSSEERRSATMVARCMAEMVNMNDRDGGILWGNWSGNYSDGTEPSAWSGSEAILDEYMRTKQPVKYAQCWVFGGTLTTTLRTLGIPARPITNFSSAHDADANRAIDYYFDEQGRPLDLSSDSVWNYHVWVEGWMTRPDIKGDFGGWQAYDATPQELSPHSNTMVVGPASLQAIKDGLDLPYDNEFVIAEVNSDVKYHQKQANGEFKVMFSDTTQVGKKISTKAVGSTQREDITLQYKYAEGTVAERVALAGGVTSADESVQFSVKFNQPIYNIGDNIVVEVISTAKKALNSGPVTISVVVEHVEYNGVRGKEIKRVQKDIWNTGSVTVGSSASVNFEVTSAEYLPDLGMQRLVNFTVMCWVPSSEQSFIHVESKRLHIPDVDIQINGQATNDQQSVQLPANQPANVVASFVNPLNAAMTKIQFYVEGSGLLYPQTLSASDAAPLAMAAVQFQITPQLRGGKNEASLVITAQSDQIKGMMGAVDVLIV